MKSFDEWIMPQQYTDNPNDIEFARTVWNAAQEQLRTQLTERDAKIAEQARDTLRMLDTIKYLVGIAERGYGVKIPDGVTVEAYVLEYVKGLEAKIAGLQAKLEGAEPVEWIAEAAKAVRYILDTDTPDNDNRPIDVRIAKAVIDLWAARASSDSFLARTGALTPELPAPPQVEAAVEDFKDRAIESMSKIIIDESWVSLYADGYDKAIIRCIDVIDSLPAFETKGETK